MTFLNLQYDGFTSCQEECGDDDFATEAGTMVDVVYDDGFNKDWF